MEAGQLTQRLLEENVFVPLLLAGTGVAIMPASVLDNAVMGDSIQRQPCETVGRNRLLIQQRQILPRSDRFGSGVGEVAGR